VTELNDAYYPGDIESIKRGIPEGRYSSEVIGLEVIKDVQCGKYIADIFKPEYRIDAVSHPEYSGETVMDNGMFRYKQVEGCLYEPKKNWGYVKFLTIAGMYDNDNKGKNLEYLDLSDIKGAGVLIDVYMKKFLNEYEKDVRYPVARAVQFTRRAEAPF